MLPEGSECAFKEGHYAYFLPSIDESEPLVPFFRNIDHARAYHDAQNRKKRARGGASKGGGGASKPSTDAAPSPAAKRGSGGKEPSDDGEAAAAKSKPEANERKRPKP